MEANFNSLLTGGRLEDETESANEKPQPILSQATQQRPHRIAEFKQRQFPTGGEMPEAHETEVRTSVPEKQDFGNGDRRTRDQSRRGGSRRRRSRRSESGPARGTQQTPSRDSAQEKAGIVDFVMQESPTPSYEPADNEPTQAIMSALVSESEAQTETEPASVSQEQEDKPEAPMIYLPKPESMQETRLGRESTISTNLPSVESFELDSSSDEEEETEAEREDSTIETPKSPRRSLAKRRGRGRRDKRFSSRRVEFGEGQEDASQEECHEISEAASTADPEHTAADNGPTEESPDSATIVVPDKPSIEKGTE